MALSAETLLEIPFPRKIAALVVVLVAALGLYLWMSYFPKQDELKQKDAKIAQLTTEKREKEVVANNLEAFREELHRLEARLDEVKRMLPTTKEIPELLFSISNLVEQSGLQLEVFEPLSEVPVDFYAEVPVSIDVTGEFTQLAVFLDKIGKLRRIVNLTDLAIQKKDAAVGSSIVLGAKGKVTTYRFLDQG